jgi:microcystin-dependent protein
MSQYDFGSIDPYVVDGVQLAGMLNQWRDAIHSMHRGGSRPAYVVPGMMWINDSAGAANWAVNVYLSPTQGDKPLFFYNTTTGSITIAAGATGSVVAAMLLAQADALPAVRWDSTGNPIDQKIWQATVTPDGQLRFGAYNDAVAVEQGYLQLERDGSIPSIVPVGTVWDFAGLNTGVPGGWYICDGSAKSRSVDTRLFGVIGTSYGAGDGSTTFNIPDLRGRVIAGIDNMGGVNANRLNSTISNPTLPGGVGGSQLHTLSLGELASHAHAGADHVHTGTTGLSFGYAAGGGYWGYTVDAGGANVLGYAAHTGSSFNALTTGGAGSNAAHNNTQPTMTMNKIIKR